MVEELKKEMRKIENLVGCKMKLDVTSKASTDELIRALLSKYKGDLSDTLRLHRLELFYDLENARKKEQRSVEVEEQFVMFKKVNKTKESEVDEEEEAEEEERLGKKNEHLRQKDVVSIRAGEIDNWKDLMELSKAYYVLEHPNSQSLTWKRRVTKKNYIDKFSDKDLIEWRVSQQFRLKSLEEWDRSREEERKLASKSSYNLDGLLDDQESRDLEDMFHILESKKQKKPKMTKLRKILMSERPFKFKDESLEDWTESYSEDSEGPGADEIEEDALDMSEKEDFQVGEIAEISKESEFDEESTISEIFSSYEEFHPYKNPDIEDDLKVETKKWKIKIPISN